MFRIRIDLKCRILGFDAKIENSTVEEKKIWECGPKSWSMKLKYECRLYLISKVVQGEFLKLPEILDEKVRT